MCRNIKNLTNYEPPASDEEVRASALQFVRKISGTTQPSKANEHEFAVAVDRIENVARELLDKWVTNAPPKNRECEAEKAKLRSAKRFGTAQ